MAILTRVFDASAIVKALVAPRRKKEDEILREQARLHQIARTELGRVESKEIGMLVPSLALIEAGAIVRRLTGSPQEARLAIRFVRNHSQGIIFDEDLQETAEELAVTTGCRAADSVYLAAARHTGAELLTDDRRMHELALQENIPSLLLRDL